MNAVANKKRTRPASLVVLFREGVCRIYFFVVPVGELYIQWYYLTFMVKKLYMGGSEASKQGSNNCK